MLDFEFPDLTCSLDAESKFTSYGALYLMVVGVYAVAPILFAWVANNSEPHYRRATAVALIFMTANAVCFSIEYIIYHPPLFIS